jgi:hypothetical protein
MDEEIHQGCTKYPKKDMRVLVGNRYIIHKGFIMRCNIVIIPVNILFQYLTKAHIAIPANQAITRVNSSTGHVERTEFKIALALSLGSSFITNTATPGELNSGL